MSERSESGLVKLPEFSFSKDGKGLFDALTARVKGQDRAIRSVVKALEVYNADLNNPLKPVSVVLCMGPSGTGKTFLARTLAGHMFGSPDALTKISCETASERHATSDILGAPPGYLGHGNPSKLSQFNIDRHHFRQVLLRQGPKVLKRMIRDISKAKAALLQRQAMIKSNKAATPEAAAKKEAEIREQLQFLEDESKELQDARKDFAENLDDERLAKYYQEHDIDAGPLFSIVLFDEIEKADEDFRKVLYGIFDEGILPLRDTTTTNFRNSIIFLTSNVGEREIGDRLRSNKMGFDRKPKILKVDRDLDQEIYDLAMHAAEREFEAPFLGRISVRAVFRPLGRDVMMEILENHIRELKGDLVKTAVPVGLEVDRDVMDSLVDRAMKYPNVGARIISTRLTEKLLPRLAAMIIDGKIDDGDIIHVKLETRENKEKLVFYNQKNPQNDKNSGDSDSQSE
ncbi:MAG: AAA family ATPase [bacterium]|nr:AAA family ATPase [bacterium]